MKKIDERYMRMAEIWSENSSCKNGKVGCLIVKGRSIISDGFNGTPSGFCKNCEDSEGNTLDRVLHAETNAISKLARSTISGEGSTLYTTTSPCFDCCKIIIQSKISRVVYSKKYRITKGLDLLKEANIKIEKL